MITTAGIHHVTGISGDAQQNVDFYAGVLGLRLVKQTVNFDDPRTYHLYYGDGVGSPGSIVTFFPWPRARQGRAGVGQVAVTSLAIPPAALGYWLERFVKFGVPHEAPSRRFGEATLSFRDRDGLQLELVATESAEEKKPFDEGRVPAAHGIRGVHSVTLWEHSIADVERALSDGFGYQRQAAEGQTTRFITGAGGAGAIVNVREVGGFLKPVEAAGTIHHVAFRASDDAAELGMREQLLSLGLHPTDVLDRKYFRSVYTREPGGVLFEIATDGPGFAVDEPLERLGERLQLPPQYEGERGTIEARLVPLRPALTPPLFNSPTAILPETNT